MTPPIDARHVSKDGTPVPLDVQIQWALGHCVSEFGLTPRHSVIEVIDGALDPQAQQAFGPYGFDGTLPVILMVDRESRAAMTDVSVKVERLSYWRHGWRSDESAYSISVLEGNLLKKPFSLTYYMSEPTPGSLRSSMPIWKNWTSYEAKQLGNTRGDRTGVLALLWDPKKETFRADVIDVPRNWREAFDEDGTLKKAAQIQAPVEAVRDAEAHRPAPAQDTSLEAKLARALDVAARSDAHRQEQAASEPVEAQRLSPDVVNELKRDFTDFPEWMNRIAGEPVRLGNLGQDVDVRILGAGNPSGDLVIHVVSVALRGPDMKPPFAVVTNERAQGRVVITVRPNGTFQIDIEIFDRLMLRYVKQDGLPPENRLTAHALERPGALEAFLRSIEPGIKRAEDDGKKTPKKPESQSSSRGGVVYEAPRKKKEPWHQKGRRGHYH